MFANAVASTQRHALQRNNIFLSARIVANSVCSGEVLARYLIGCGLLDFLVDAHGRHQQGFGEHGFDEGDVAIVGAVDEGVRERAAHSVFGTAGVNPVAAHHGYGAAGGYVGSRDVAGG